MSSLVLPPGWEKKGSNPGYFSHPVHGTAYELFSSPAGGEDPETGWWWGCSAQAYVALADIPLDDGSGKKVLKVAPEDGAPLGGQARAAAPVVVVAPRRPLGAAPAPAPARRAAPAPRAAPEVVIPTGPAAPPAAAPNDGAVVAGDRPPPRIPAPWYEKARDDDYVVFENRESGQKTSELWGEEPPLPGTPHGVSWYSFRRRERYDATPHRDGRVILVSIPVPPPPRPPKWVGKGGAAGGGAGAKGAAPAPAAALTWKEKEAAKKAAEAEKKAADAARAAAKAAAAAVPAAARPALPEGWTTGATDDGDAYFYREDTGVSVWALWLQTGAGEWWNCATWERVAARPDVAPDDEAAAVVTPDGARVGAAGAPAPAPADDAPAPAPAEDESAAAAAAPEAASPEADAPAAAAGGGDDLAPGWAPMVDEDSGETFYYKAETGETTWEKPTA